VFLKLLNLICCWKSRWLYSKATDHVSIRKRTRFMNEGLSFPLRINHRHINYIEGHHQFADTIYYHCLFFSFSPIYHVRVKQKMHKIFETRIELANLFIDAPIAWHSFPTSILLVRYSWQQTAALLSLFSWHNIVRSASKYTQYMRILSPVTCIAIIWRIWTLLKSAVIDSIDLLTGTIELSISWQQTNYSHRTDGQAIFYIPINGSF